MILQGDRDAFDQIFNKYKNEAVRTAYLITGRKSICEDIAQEAFIKCYKPLGRRRNPEGFHAWFVRILTRPAWKYGRAASREIPTENMAEAAGPADPDPAARQYWAVEESRRLHTEIGLLKPKQKAVIILYYFNGLSTKEIAKVSGCLEGTVKSRLFTARENLRARMDAGCTMGEERLIRGKCKAI